jgi:hypothetical protein
MCFKGGYIFKNKKDNKNESLTNQKIKKTKQKSVGDFESDGRTVKEKPH